MILGALCAVVGFIVGFSCGVMGANKGNENAAKCGFISIRDTAYKLVPMDKDAERKE